MDRRFNFRRLLPGALKGPAGRRAACLYALLRNSFLEKWGFFVRQRPLPEQRAASASATVQRGRAAPGRSGLSARSACQAPGRPASTPTLPTSSPATVPFRSSISFLQSRRAKPSLSPLGAKNRAQACYVARCPGLSGPWYSSCPTGRLTLARLFISQTFH